VEGKRMLPRVIGGPGAEGIDGEPGRGTWGISHPTARRGDGRASLANATLVKVRGSPLPRPRRYIRGREQGAALARAYVVRRMETRQRLRAAAGSTLLALCPK